jgi:YidC/Oxa1 family membrane protein insertase
VSQERQENNRRLTTALLIGVALILVWQPLVTWVGRQLGYDLSPRVSSTQPTAAPSDSPATNPAIASTATAGTAPTTQSASETPATAPAGTWRIVASVEPTTAPANTQAIGSGEMRDKTWALQVVSTPRGAGIESVALNDYLATQYDKAKPYRFGETFPDDKADAARALATRSIVIGGQEVDLSRAVWNINAPVIGTVAQEQSYTIDLTDGVRKLTLKKTFRVLPRTESVKLPAQTVSGKEGRAGFEVYVTHELKAEGGAVDDVRLNINGVLFAPTEVERNLDTYFVVGFLDASDRFDKTAHFGGSFSAKQPSIDLLKPNRDGQRPLWFATTTTYFNAIVRPESTTGDPKQSSAWWDKAEAVALRPDGATSLEKDIVTRIATKPLRIESSATTLNMAVFFGPRKREVLQNPYYLSTYVNYGETLVVVSGPCSYCTFNWLVELLYWILSGFRWLTKDWAVSIILLVALVRLCLHPITRFSQLQMLKMGKMGPELERLKKKYGDNKEELNRAMMQLYREQGASPIFGCLPMFLQMPIWIALWQAMNTTFDLRHQPAFYGLFGNWWLTDLSRPDHLIDFHYLGWQTWHFNIPLCFLPISISGLNILPLVFGVLQYITMKLQPQPAAMSEEQAAQQKLTQRMILVLMPVMLYASPSGLMIYMITSFLVGIWESKRIRAEYKRREAEAEMFKTAPGQSLTAGRAAAAAKKGWLARKMEELQQRAQQMQEQVEKQRRDQGRKKK